MIASVPGLCMLFTFTSNFLKAREPICCDIRFHTILKIKLTNAKDSSIVLI